MKPLLLLALLAILVPPDALTLRQITPRPPPPMHRTGPRVLTPPSPRLEPTWKDGSFSLPLSIPWTNWVAERSTDLRTWQPWATNHLPPTDCNILLDCAASAPQGFYRIRLLQ